MIITYFILGTLAFVLVVVTIVVGSLYNIQPKQERKLPSLPFQNSLNNYWEKVTTNEVALSIGVLFLAALLFVIVSLVVSNLKLEQEFWGGVLVEMVGMLFDIVLLLLLVNWIKSKGEKRLTIKRYLEELDDYRGWHEDEAKFRVKGILNRYFSLTNTPVELSGLHLGGIEKSILIRTVFNPEILNQSLCLSGADFYKASLVRSDLTNMNLKGAEFGEADLELANFQGSNLQNAHLFRSNLHMADLSFTSLEGAMLSLANLSEADLTLSKITGVDLGGANLIGAILDRCNLEEADLTQAILINCTLDEANLQNAKLSSANLAEASCKEADFSGAIFTLANFKNASLQGANFTGADLRFSDFKNANLEGAKLIDVKLDGVKNLTKTQLRSAILKR